MPKISIITPSYNHSRFLAVRVDSILSQTLADFEWIIIDDASRDESPQLLDELTKQDTRVQLIFHDRNVGLSGTVREAFEHSSGEYIYRAESDDVCASTFLERMMTTLEQNPNAGFAFCRSRSMDKDGHLWGGNLQPTKDKYWQTPDLFRALLKRNFIAGGNVLVRREAYETVGGFGQGPFTVSCDHHLHLRLSMNYDAVYVSEPLAYHRIHSQNLSQAANTTFDLDTAFRESYELLLDVFASIPAEQVELIRLKDAAIRRVSIRIAAPLYVQARTSGNTSIATGILNRVEQYDPGVTKTRQWYWQCKVIPVRRRFYSIYQSTARRSRTRSSMGSV